MAARMALTFSPLPGSLLCPRHQCREIARRWAGRYCRRPMILQTVLRGLPRVVKGKTNPPSFLRALWSGTGAMPLSQDGSAPSERRMDHCTAGDTKELLPIRCIASPPPLALLRANFRQSRGQTGALTSLATPLPQSGIPLYTRSRVQLQGDDALQLVNCYVDGTDEGVRSNPEYAMLREGCVCFVALASLDARSSAKGTVLVFSQVVVLGVDPLSVPVVLHCSLGDSMIHRSESGLLAWLFVSMPEAVPLQLVASDASFTFPDGPDDDFPATLSAIVGFTAELEPRSRPNQAAGRVDMWFCDEGGRTSLTVCTFGKVDLLNPPARKLAKLRRSRISRRRSNGLTPLPLAFASLCDSTPSRLRIVPFLFPTLCTRGMSPWRGSRCPFPSCCLSVLSPAPTPARTPAGRRTTSSRI